MENADIEGRGDGVHAHDLASIMNDHAVAIRAGDHCTQPLHDMLGTAASVGGSGPESLS